MKSISHNTRTALAAMAVSMLLFGGAACSSQKAGMASPELPARHWLDEAPGIPIENKEQYDAAVPNLYNPDKAFSFEDCVYLTIQQSPNLVNSAVNIEIKKLDRTSAFWKYLPEPHLTLRVSQNLTMQNRGGRYTNDEYGQMQYEISYYAPFPNPVATHFETKAQTMLMGIAISTHRKAVGEAIFKIAEAYLRLQAQQYILQAHRSLVPLARELTEYWRHVESVDGSQGASVSLAQQREREAELGLEKAEMEETMQRTTLKVLAGLDPYQQFKVDLSNADTLVKNFDGARLSWQDRWLETEDNLLLRAQIKLADYNIMLAWAQYVPNMSFAVNMSPPRGQSQPSDGPADQFLHFTFDFPLLDWGRRYRGVQTARMTKAQAFHTLAEKRFNYQSKWLQAEQQVSLALTNLKLAENRLETARMQYEEARISFENGLESLPTVAQRQAQFVQDRINYIKVELDYHLAKLQWMHVSGVLQKRFLGLPDRELSELVGGQHLNASTPSASNVPYIDEDDKKVFPEEQDKRPIGRELPRNYGVGGPISATSEASAPAEAAAPAAAGQSAAPAATPAASSGDLKTVPSLPAAK